MSEQHRYDSRDELDAALTETIATQLDKALRLADPRASLSQVAAHQRSV